MSVKLMSAIFDTEFSDLPTGEYTSEGKAKMAKASSCKIQMLAIADHANDEGEGAYPGLTKLEKKTGLSRQGVIDVQKALKFNGLLSVSDLPSKLGTNDYKINLQCLPILKDASQATLLVKPLDQSSHLTGNSQVTLPAVVKSLDLKHPLTTKEPSLSLSPDDFAAMSVEKAHKVPELKLYASATGFFPGSLSWHYVYSFIRENKLTKERIHAAAEQWELTGYQKTNVKGILEWARDGVPEAKQRRKENGKKPVTTEPKGFDAARKFLERQAQQNG